MTINYMNTPMPLRPREAQAEAVAEALQQALAAKGRAVLAVSGGKSPIAFEALSQIDLDWANIGITLVDERIVPTTHAGKQYRRAPISAEKPSGGSQLDPDDCRRP